MDNCIKISCSKNNLKEIRNFVNETLKNLCVPELEISMLVLAVDEICANRIIHSNHNNQNLFLELKIKRIDSSYISFEIIDEGEPFDHTNYIEPNINQLIKDKRKDLWHSQQQAQELIPQLLARKARPQGRPLVQYYEDDEGVVAILKDVLQVTAKLDNPEYRVFTSRPIRQYLYRKFPKFTDRRVADGITVKAIAIGEGGDPAGYAERRWLAEPKEGDVSSYTIIYGDKVAQISIANDTPYGVVIEDAGTAAMQRLLFEQIWSTL